MRTAQILPLVAAALLLGATPLLAGGDPFPTSAAARWGADYFPNVPLVTHEGETLRFFDDMLRDKVVVLSFIYTSCPDACPLETAKLTEVHSLLGERVGKDVFMYSISIDPEHDTPEVLRAYSERFQTGAGWKFLTGDKADIKLIRQKLGMIASGGEERLQDHTLSLMIGNQATGQWMKRSPMENPYFLATQIGSWLSNWKLPPEPGRAYADAPRLREISRGENLFRTRCMTCHLIGPDDGLQRQGPNLLGVSERRERAWLARWLAEPDVMLAEKDPIALALFEANRNLPMPNMRLAPLEVDSLLVYMEEESARVQAELDAAAAAMLDSAETDIEVELEPGLGARPACCEKRDGLVLGDDDESEGPGPDAGALAELLAPEPSAAPLVAAAPRAWPEPAQPVPAAAPVPVRVAPDAAGLSLQCLGLALALGTLALVAYRRV